LGVLNSGRIPKYALEWKRLRKHTVIKSHHNLKLCVSQKVKQHFDHLFFLLVNPSFQHIYMTMANCMKRTVVSYANFYLWILCCDLIGWYVL